MQGTSEVFYIAHHSIVLCFTSLDRDNCDFQRQQKIHSTVWHKIYRNNSEIPFSSALGALLLVKKY